MWKLSYQEQCNNWHSVNQLLNKSLVARVSKRLSYTTSTSEFSSDMSCCSLANHSRNRRRRWVELVTRLSMIANILWSWEEGVIIWSVKFRLIFRSEFALLSNPSLDHFLRPISLSKQSSCTNWIFPTTRVRVLRIGRVAHIVWNHIQALRLTRLHIRYQINRQALPNKYINESNINFENLGQDI